MIVYHGTTMVLKKPNVAFSKDYLDFGKGFYVTPYREQAERWALRKGIRKQMPAYINIYKMEDDLTPYKVLSFEEENEKWLDFVCACRKGDKKYQNYDVIIGNVADDDVFKTVDMYFRGIWSKEKALKELRYYKMNNQICIINQFVLEKILTFQKVYEVKKKNDR